MEIPGEKRTLALRARGAAVPRSLSGGCSGLLHSTRAPEQTYYLRAPAARPATAPSAATAASAANGAAGVARGAGASLRVGHPLADPGLDSSHIMLVQADHRMNFYTGSRWAAPAADVIEALAVETLRASGAWTSVEDSSSPFPSDYLLQIAVRRFEADYTAGGAVPGGARDARLHHRHARRARRGGHASALPAPRWPAANRLSDVVARLRAGHAARRSACCRSRPRQAVRAARGSVRLRTRTSPAPSSSRQSQ